MKTKNSVLSGLGSGLARAGSRFAAMAALLVASAGSLSATQVAWISGGPNAGYPSGAGYVDGDLTEQAEYNTPSGLAIDISGDELVVADRNNNAVRVLVFSQNITGTLLAYTNNVQANNLFTQPIGVALDPDYNLFVLCRGTGKNGYVMEFDYMGNLIATNMANITNAGGIALDGNDNIFVTASNSVFEVSALTGAVTDLATVTAANSSLQGIVVKHNGLLAVCDTGRNGILLINPGSGVVTTNAGFHGQGDFVSAENIAYSNTATFYQPSGITESGDGTLIVTDFGNDRVKAVLANGEVTNVYGISSKYWTPPYPGFQDGTVALPDNYGGVAGREEYGVVVAPDGSLYVSEDYYHIIRHVTDAGFIPEPVAPNAPATLTATVVTNSGLVGVLVQWSGSQGATNYLVEKSTSTNSFAMIGDTAADNYLDTNVQAGYTYYYVVQAEGTGGISPISPIAGVTIPVPPPDAPEIGWYDFEPQDVNGILEYASTLHPISPGNPYIAHNPLNLAIDPTVYSGVSTHYITSPPSPTNASASYIVSNGGNPPEYVNAQVIGSFDVNPLPPLPLSNGLVTVYAVNVNGVNEDSAVASASVEYEIGSPTIFSPNGGALNAAQFTVSDVSTNVIFYYTLDGSDPTNAPASQQVYTTNGIMNLSLNGSTNINFQVRAIGYGPEADYLMSGIASYLFTPGTFVPNEISWGFASGECSSEFIGAPGQLFIAPVTLTMLPGVGLYSMQFNMTVSSTGPGITNPAPAAGPFHFQSMLMKPVPNDPGVFVQIPPYALASELPQDIDPNYVNYNGEQFINLAVSNGNELAVGWVERAGFTNLYNTLSQTLIKYSLAHDDMFPDAAQDEPNGVIVGGYMFKLSPATVDGQQYQLELSRASGTSDGVGAPGAGVDLYAADLTNSASLAPGTLSGIKNVSVGSIPYLVGNVYPFRWFNAGDFGNSNLQSADVEQVFQSAVYGLNTPVVDITSLNSSGGYTNVSDMYDAEDSCGQLGYPDNNPADVNFGFYTNAGPLTLAQKQQLFSGNYSLVNNMAFGDGTLDISDLYLTFLRSEFTNDFVWFQRMWTNGVRVANPTWAPGIIPPGTGGGGVGGGQPAVALSITNTPIVNFTATDFVASAGQTLSIPINASVFGPYPMRMVMLNMSVVPLDGAPALTSPINFTPDASMNTAFGSSVPYSVNSTGNGNYSAAWLPNTLNITQLPGYANTANLGTLTVTIPTNATSTSSYAIHFDSASGSPSGLLSFPSRTLTGLITLCSRTNSAYNDSIPDSWRLRYFGTIYNELSVSNADADGTGMNNWQKYCAGLNPVDPSSILNEGTDQSMAQSPSDMVLYWPSVSGKTYIIKRSSALFSQQWTTISTNIGNGTYMEIHDSAGGPTRYYEVTTP